MTNPRESFPDFPNRSARGAGRLYGLNVSFRGRLRALCITDPRGPVESAAMTNEKWQRGVGTGIGLSNHVNTYRCADDFPPVDGLDDARRFWKSASVNRPLSSLTSPAPLLLIPTTTDRA